MSRGELRTDGPNKMLSTIKKPIFYCMMKKISQPACKKKKKKEREDDLFPETIIVGKDFDLTRLMHHSAPRDDHVI